MPHDKRPALDTNRWICVKVARLECTHPYGAKAVYSQVGLYVQPRVMRLQENFDDAYQAAPHGYNPTPPYGYVATGISVSRLAWVLLPSHHRYLQRRYVTISSKPRSSPSSTAGQPGKRPALDRVGKRHRHFVLVLRGDRAPGGNRAGNLGGNCTGRVTTPDGAISGGLPGLFGILAGGNLSLVTSIYGLTVAIKRA